LRFDIAGVCPAEFTSDYFDYIPLRDGGIGLAIADVCGHGLGPALLMASTQAFLRSSAEVHDDLGQILGHVNHCLADVAEQHRFVTLFLGRVDPARSYTSPASHRLCGCLRGCQSPAGNTAQPLAIAPKPRSLEVIPRSGRHILLLTDGILEAAIGGGRCVRDRALLEVRTAELQASDVVRLFEAVRALRAGETVDDITAWWSLEQFLTGNTAFRRRGRAPVYSLFTSMTFKASRRRR
jgi:sigma-B regulation protein RsbU (phosphoserine phosphatase)